MKASEIRDLSDDELRAQALDAREDLMRLRFQYATGELTDHTRLQHARKVVARFLTIARERELGIDQEGEA